MFEPVLLLGLGGFGDWVQEQALIILFVAVIVLSLILGIKRQWIALVGSLAGFAIIAIFVAAPEMIQTIGQTMAGWIGLG